MPAREKSSALFVLTQLGTVVVRVKHEPKCTLRIVRYLLLGFVHYFN